MSTEFNKKNHSNNKNIHRRALSEFEFKEKLAHDSNKSVSKNNQNKQIKKIIKLSNQKIKHPKNVVVQNIEHRANVDCENRFFTFGKKVIKENKGESILEEIPQASDYLKSSSNRKSQLNLQATFNKGKSKDDSRIKNRKQSFSNKQNMDTSNLLRNRKNSASKQLLEDKQKDKDNKQKTNQKSKSKRPESNYSSLKQSVSQLQNQVFYLYKKTNLIEQQNKALYKQIHKVQQNQKIGKFLQQQTSHKLIGLQQACTRNQDNLSFIQQFISQQSQKRLKIENQEYSHNTIDTQKAGSKNTSSGKKKVDSNFYITFTQNIKKKMMR